MTTLAVRSRVEVEGFVSISFSEYTSNMVGPYPGKTPRDARRSRMSVET